VAWVRLNTQIDGTVQNAITTAIHSKYSGSAITFDSLSLNGANGAKAATVTVVTISSKSGALNASEIETLLAKLPNTTDVNAASGTGTVGSSTPTPTVSLKPTPTVNATATASSNATATAQGTPAATSTPAATATTTANPAATIPVKVAQVQVGQTTDTINILTTTTTNISSERQIKAVFLNKTGNFLYTMDNSSVSPSVASATINYSILAVIAASVLILLYVWFAFRKVNRPWRYGACAIIALLHDVLVVMGVFSILGWTLHIQVDSLFITALLTVVGFSVHDTIVVFDRIRENMQHRSSESFDQVVNASLVQTMARSLNTSLTVLFTLSALTLFGGDSIRPFTLALLIGVFSGTYSSIFNASMLLVIWEHGELGISRFQRNRDLPGGRKRSAARERELAKSRG
jgi:preprotein translocase SecF subunit